MSYDVMYKDGRDGEPRLFSSHLTQQEAEATVAELGRIVAWNVAIWVQLEKDIR